MKKLLLLFSATVAALLAGAAVFLWTGHDPSEVNLEAVSHKLNEIVQPVREHLAPAPSPAPLSPSVKEPEQPTYTEPQAQPAPPAEITPPSNPEPPAQPAAPPATPMADYSESDKEELENILGQ